MATKKTQGRTKASKKSAAAAKSAENAKKIKLITTTNLPQGYKLKKVVGLVWGSEVRTKSVTSSIVAFFRTFKGGDINEFSNLMREARRATVERMVANALDMGANGIIGVRIAATNVRTDIAEFIAYGTAVVIE